jgi:uncharacterized SAM-binding protein YcdF (DUF218 family)
LVALSLRFCLRKRHRLGLSLAALALILSISETARIPARLAARKEAAYYEFSISRLTATNINHVDAVVQCGGLLSPSPYDLSGANYSDSVDRLLASVEAARRLHLPLVLGGGAAGGNGAPPESTFERAWLANWGLTNFTVMDLGVCRDTHDEALAAARLAKLHGWKRILLVTSAIHMDRAWAAFQRTGLEVVPLACDFDGPAAPNGKWTLKLLPSIGSAALFKMWLTEEVGLWYYWLRGWASSAPEQIQELIGAKGIKDFDEPFHAVAHRECLGPAGQNTSF